MDCIDDAYIFGVIDDEEYCMLNSGGGRIHEGRPFRFDDLSDVACMKSFRFRKEDIPTLAVALRFPDEVVTDNGVKASGLESLCILLRRLALKGRHYEMENLFGLEESSINRLFA